MFIVYLLIIQFSVLTLKVALLQLLSRLAGTSWNILKIDSQNIFKLMHTRMGVMEIAMIIDVDSIYTECAGVSSYSSVFLQ